MKLQSNYKLQTFLAVATQRKSEMTSYSNNGYDAMNCFAKFEKFLPHSIIIQRFMSEGSQIPELRPGGGGFWPPPYKIGGQNTPYKLGLSIFADDWQAFWCSSLKTDKSYIAMTKSRRRATSHSAVFRACKYAIKDTKGVSQVKDG